MIRKKDAIELYHSICLEVVRSHAGVLKAYRERGEELAVVLDDPKYAKALRKGVKDSSSVEDALRPPVYAVARALRRYGTHPMIAMIEYQQTLTMVSALAVSKYGEAAVKPVADELADMTAGLLGLPEP